MARYIYSKHYLDIGNSHFVIFDTKKKEGFCITCPSTPAEYFKFNCDADLISIEPILKFFKKNTDKKYHSEALRKVVEHLLCNM